MKKMRILKNKYYKFLFLIGFFIISFLGISNVNAMINAPFYQTIDGYQIVTGYNDNDCNPIIEEDNYEFCLYDENDNFIRTLSYAYNQNQCDSEYYACPIGRILKIDNNYLFVGGRKENYGSGTVSEEYQVHDLYVSNFGPDVDLNNTYNSVGISDFSQDIYSVISKIDSTYFTINDGGSARYNRNDYTLEVPYPSITGQTDIFFENYETYYSIIYNENGDVTEYTGLENGECGTSATTYTYDSTDFTGDLCTSGTANPTSPVFPLAGSYVSWDCEGSGGGTTATCTATREATPTIINGECGTAEKNYNYYDYYFTGDLCTSGTANPTSPVFPLAGSSISWDCEGSGGGTTTICTATREATPTIINGECGTSATTYTYDSTDFTGDLCTSGTANPTSPVFPLAGSSVSWDCEGSGGGTTAICTATVNTNDTSGWFPDFGSLGDGLNNIVTSINKFFDFEFQYTGFNLDFNDLKNLFSINIDNNNYTINNSNCENISNEKVTYYKRTWSGISGYLLVNYTAGIYQDNLPSCTFSTNYTFGYPELYNESDIIIGQYYNYNRYDAGSDSDPTDEIARHINESKCIYKYDPSVYGNDDGDTVILEKDFNYVSKTSNTNLIIFNSAPIIGFKFIPFIIKIFGFDFTGFINNIISGTLNIIINIIIYPINGINLIYGDFSLLLKSDFPDNFCYWGMNINKIELGTAESLNLPDNYTGNSDLGFYIIFLFVSGFIFYLIKKI